MKPRLHAEMIKAWAEGCEIQYRKDSGDKWVDSPDPAWLADYEYRIKPVREYPQTTMTEGEIEQVYLMHDGPCIPSIVATVNIALRHAIDNGQVVTREEFDKVSAELNSVYKGLSRPGGVIKIPALPEHFQPKWREFVPGFGSIEGDKEVVQSIKAEFDRAITDRNARDMAVAKTVQEKCYAASLKGIGYLDIAAIIAEVKP